MKKIRLLATFITLLPLVFPAGNVKAGIVADVYEGIATEVTQIANNIELISTDAGQWKEVYQQVTQLEHEVQMITNQLINLEKLAEDPLSAIPLTNTLEQLDNAIKQGQVLSYASANIDEKYAELFPGYETYISEALTNDVMQQKYQDWSQGNMMSIKDALKEANLQNETMSNEKERLNTLETMSQTVDGRLQAIQAGTLVSIEEAKSLQRLRKLVADNNQLHANYMAKQQDEEDVHTAQFQQMTGGGESPALGSTWGQGVSIQSPVE